MILSDLYHGKIYGIDMFQSDNYTDWVCYSGTETSNA